MSYVRTFLLAIVILSASSAVFAETITMSTYYPSPSGNYQNMTNDVLTVTGHILFLTGGQSYVEGITGGNLYLNAGNTFSAANGIVIGSTGNVGIKTVPTVALDVNGDIEATGDITTSGGTITATTLDVTNITSPAASGPMLSLMNNVNVEGNLTFTGARNITTTGTITASSLNVGSITNPNGRLSLNDDVDVSGNLIVNGLISSADLKTEFADNNTVIVNGVLEVKGYIWTGDVFKYSDEAIKEDIVHITNAIEKVKAINGVYFKYKGKEETKMGLIAQNVEKVVPEVVMTDKDGLKAVDYASLVGLLIEAVKEQQVIIEELQKKDEDRGRKNR